MEIMKLLEFDSFLKYKGKTVDVEFPATLYVFEQPGNRKIELDSNIIIEKNIGKNDYVLIFMNDMVRTYVGGYVQMWVSYLQNVKFDGEYLGFTTSNGVQIKLK